MAKLWLSGRRRAQSNEQSTEAAGDVAPTWNDVDSDRDPQSPQRGDQSPPSRIGRSFSRKKVVSERPKTAPAPPRSKSKGRRESHNQNAKAAYVDQSSSNRGDVVAAATDDANDASIGVALGSPSIPPKFLGTSPCSRYSMTESDDPKSRASPEEADIKAKGGVWKKPWGLFRSKSTFLCQTPPAAFAFGQSPTQNSEKTLQQVQNAMHPSTFDPQMAQAGPTMGSDDAQQLQGLSLGQGNHEMTHRVGTIPLVGPRTHPLPSSEPLLPRKFGETRNKPNLGGRLPRLEISVPDVEMERYSVMFGNLLGKSPAASLRTRRNVMLERVTTKFDEEGKPVSHAALSTGNHHTGLGIATNGDGQSRLSPHRYPRRATSPSSSRSPSLSSASQTPVANQNMCDRSPETPRPGLLQRSMTAPPRLSPMQDQFEFERPGIERRHYAKEHESVTSPAETSSSATHGTFWSTDGSALSPASTINSIHEEDILFDVKSLSTLGEHEEPQYEMVDHSVEAGLTGSKSRKIPTHEPREWWAKQPDEARSRPRHAHDETLAALERPASPISRCPDIAPLRPTKARIDQVMGASLAILPAKSAVSTVSTPSPMENCTRPVEKCFKHLGSPQGIPPIRTKPFQTRFSRPTPIVFPVGAESDSYVPSPDFATSSKFSPPSSRFAVRPGRPTRAATDRPKPSHSAALDTARQQAALLASKSDENLAGLAALSRQPLTVPENQLNKPQIDAVEPPVGASHSEPSPSGRSSTEIAVARSVSLSRQASRRLVVPAVKRVEALNSEGGEKFVNRQALMPTIVDAHRGHRPARSMSLVIETA